MIFFLDQDWPPWLVVQIQSGSAHGSHSSVGELGMELTEEEHFIKFGLKGFYSNLCP